MFNNENEIQTEKFARLRYQALEMLKQKPDIVSTFPVPDTKELFAELNIYHAELVFQNEELKRAQQELTALYREYEELYEFAPCGYLTLNSQGIVTRVNLSGVALLGAEKVNLMLRGFSRYVASESQNLYFQAIEKASKTGEKQNLELELIKENGTSLWVVADIQADKSETGELIQWRVILMDITERKQAEDLKKQVIERDLMFRELCHRTKNNMNMICAMMNLQAMQTNSREFIRIVNDVENRIQSMSLIYEKLHRSKQSEYLSGISLNQYILDITNRLMESYNFEPGRISVKYNMDDIFICPDTAIFCGLILNEVISNAMKYAFPENRRGEIKIGLHRNAEGMIELNISDNGIGLPKIFDPRHTDTMGCQIIFMIVECQLKGNVSFEGTNGVSWRIELPADSKTKFQTLSSIRD